MDQAKKKGRKVSESSPAASSYSHSDSKIEKTQLVGQIIIIIIILILIIIIKMKIIIIIIIILACSKQHRSIHLNRILSSL